MVSHVYSKCIALCVLSAAFQHDRCLRYDLRSEKRKSRYSLYAAKFCVLLFYLFMEMLIFLAVFIADGLVAKQTMGITRTLLFSYLLKWCL